MMLLSDEEISDLWVTELDDRETVTKFARAIEAALLAKLDGAELPEPVSAQFQTLNKSDWHNFIDAKHQANTEADGRWTMRYLFTADQLRQAYAQEAASQLDRLEKAERLLFELREAAAAVVSNEEHAFSGGMRKYAEGSQTWQVYEDLRIAMEASK